MMSTHTRTQKLHEIKRIRANFGKIILGKIIKKSVPPTIMIGEYACKKIRNDYKQKVNNYSFDGKKQQYIFFIFGRPNALDPPPPLRPTLSCFARPRPGGSAGRPLWMPPKWTIIPRIF